MHAFQSKQKQPTQQTSSSTTRLGAPARLQRSSGHQSELKQDEAKSGEASSARRETSLPGHHFANISIFSRSMKGIQPKLTVNTPGDTFEQEADRVSDHVMRMSNPGAAVAPAVSGGAKVQMKAAGPGAAGGIDAPPVVQKALRSAGQPLDAATRAFMEPRFGHDFSHVRVHADEKAAESAQALQARAYTVGSNIVFGAGQFEPGAHAGRGLLAHELTHVLQQQGQTSGVGRDSGESSGLEREASDGAARVVSGGSARIAASPSTPAIQRFKISSGGFGKELESSAKNWAIPDSTLKLLMKSPTFMAMVNTLDSHYLSSDDAMQHGFPSFVIQKGYQKLDPSGKISGVSKSVDGKRVIHIAGGIGGAAFKPAWNPDNPFSGDVIEMTAATREIFIQELIHESTHATRFITGANPSATTMADEINVGIHDEIAARTTEEKGLKEIPDAGVQARAATVGSKNAREVQRDMAPALGVTYMENIYFGHKLREKQKAENIPDTEAEQIASSVRANPDSGIFYERSLNSPLSDFAWLCYQRAQVIKEWKDFFKTNKLSDPGFAANKEKVLQSHVTKWMNSEVSYLP
jgi:Domain of unknown function (DUF4157)